ncbi:MAG: hypothetical protein KGD63_15100 [Candidatus Lokiarchaeota archaeon]|nr:hypothetical protein [Candidatus Lokiarchaeota archaeon]
MIIIFECYECGQIYRLKVFNNGFYFSLLGNLISKEQLTDNKGKFRCIDCNEKDNFLILKKVD